jgi:hypothetical protein
MKLLDPWWWLSLAVMAALGFGSGYAVNARLEQGKRDKQALAQVKDTLVDEREARTMLRRAGSAYLTNERLLQEAHREQLQQLQNQLSNENAQRCRISGATLRLLDGRSPELPAATGAGLGAGSASASASAAQPGNCERELNTCALNYREVCEPNARQLNAVLKAWAEQVNKQRGKRDE